MSLLQSDRYRARAPDAVTLLGIARDALAIKLPLYVSSVMGLPWTWLPPFERYSEFRIIDLWRLRRTFHFLLNICLPAIPRTPPTVGLPILHSLFWQPTVILQRPDQYGSYTTFPDEAWFFINGILTNDSVAQVNAAYLAYLFHRPITLIQNSTCGFPQDLLECAFGKQWHRTTESVIKAFPAIYAALKSSKQRVVVIAHSQGTIIASVVVWLLEAITAQAEAESPPQAATRERAAAPYALPEFVYPEEDDIYLEDFEPLAEAELAKLELYCFANCANTMTYLRPDRAIPYLESFGNEYDIVARLGMSAPRAKKWGIRIDGPRYVHPQAWGHLLNEHYLSAVEKCQKVRHIKGGQRGSTPYQLINAEDYPAHSVPRLFSYINGGEPPDMD